MKYTLLISMKSWLKRPFGRAVAGLACCLFVIGIFKLYILLGAWGSNWEDAAKVEMTYGELPVHHDPTFHWQAYLPFQMAVRSVNRVDWDSPGRAGWASVETRERFIRIIKTYPGSKQALNCKLMLGIIDLYMRGDASWFFDQANKTLGEIIRNHVGSWQAVFAKTRLHSSQAIRTDGQEGVDELINYLSFLENWNQDDYPEFRKFYRTLFGSSGSPDDHILLQTAYRSLVYGLSRLDDRERIQKYATLAKKRFPKSGNLSQARQVLKMVESGENGYAKKKLANALK